MLDKVTRASGQETYAQKAQKRRKSKMGTDQPTERPTDRVLLLFSSAGEIRKFEMHLQKRSSLRNLFWKRTLFSIFSVIYFLS